MDTIVDSPVIELCKLMDLLGSCRGLACDGMGASLHLSGSYVWLGSFRGVRVRYISQVI